jgi:hypothetical protein
VRIALGILGLVLLWWGGRDGVRQPPKMTVREWLIDLTVKTSVILFSYYVLSALLGGLL